MDHHMAKHTKFSEYQTIILTYDFKTYSNVTFYCYKKKEKKNFHFISRRMHQIRFNLCNFLTHQKCHFFALLFAYPATSARGLLLTVLTFVQIVNSNFVCNAYLFVQKKRFVVENFADDGCNACNSTKNMGGICIGKTKKNSS